MDRDCDSDSNNDKDRYTESIFIGDLREDDEIRNINLGQGRKLREKREPDRESKWTD
jgi:hypothetical protein